MQLFGKLSSGQKGQNLIEFVLLFPIIILSLATIVDFSLALNRRIVLQHAVREGARMAAVSEYYTGANGVCEYTCEQAQGAVDPTKNITFTYEDLDNNRQYNMGDNVRVTLPAEWDLPILKNALTNLFGHDIKIDLTTTASARLERTVAGDSECPICPP